jgi:endo-1,4-beta-xylanase
MDKEIPSLNEVFGDHFLIGAAVNLDTLVSQQKLIKKHFNSITAENDMKFEHLQPEEGQFHFGIADKIVSFAKENGMKVRGHTLVWHNQTPNWMFINKDGSAVNRETLLERMKTHITTVIERYKGEIYCWDVVNEVIEDNGSNLLRESKWTEIIGDDFIEKAFEYAHQANPEALLFYNDYNESHPEKREKIYSFVKGLTEKGVPIHGIGLQAHWSLSGPSYENIKASIKKYASLGLTIHLTEMDVSVF